MRSSLVSHSSLYVFTADNVRNAPLKRVRRLLPESRLFFGRTKLLAAALGKSPAEEFRDGLSGAARMLRGHEAGLLFTSVPHDDVLRILSSCEEEEFARAGNEATRTVELEEGPLDGFPHNMEPYLRKLGLPTALKEGVVTLLAPHTVCVEGKALDGDQAKLLQLLGIKMSVFKLSLLCRWSDGDLEVYEQPE